jgi:uncharacterized membrane protein YdjX (TVP38/TMEM64 family)
VFAVDDDLFCIGSANLSNRSMALDTECSIAIEAQGDEPERRRIRDAITRLRDRLLAEHLGTTPELVEAEIRQRGGSLHQAVEALQHPGRTLRVMEPQTTPELEALIPEQALFDPEKPIDPDQLVADFVPPEQSKPLPRRLIGLGLLAIGLAALALAWRWTPLREWANLDALVTVARHLDALPFTPAAVVGAYVAAGLLVVPVTLLIAVTGLVFGPWEGMLYAAAGTLCSALLTYGAGHWLGHDSVRRLVGPRINRLSQHIAKRGILAMVVLRLLPVAPFTVVNVVAGASHIRLRDYLVGTFLGMGPGIVMTVLFAHHLAEAIRKPSPGTIAVLALVSALIIGAALGLRRMLKRKEDKPA